MQTPTAYSGFVETLEGRVFLAVTPAAPPDVRDLATIGNIVYFSGTEKKYGDELWRTDGSKGGTRLVKDIFPGKFSGDPGRLIAAGKTLFFRAVDKKGPGLWATRGTAATTVKLVALDYSYYELGKDGLYFCAWRNKKPELWKSDGTVKGTKLVRSLPAWPQSISEYVPKAAQKTKAHYFVKETQPPELWYNDGATAGDRQIGVMDGPTVPGCHDDGAPPDAIPELVAAGTKLFAIYRFMTRDEGYQCQLWSVDPKTAAMRRLKNVNAVWPPGVEENPYLRLDVAAVIDTGILFNIYNSDGETETWFSSGTIKGTVRLRPEAKSAFEIRTPIKVSGKLFFLHEMPLGEGQSRNSLWVWEYAAKQKPRLV